MLDRLTITNYALIENLDFNPGEGLSIITGETGAGKSIMIGALSLLKGERADTRVIADKSRKSIVEATFSGISQPIREKIKELDPEWDGEQLIIRREISPSGRSRAFLNDSPVNLFSLAEISRGLLDIHSQNSNSLLSESAMQLSLVDSFAGNASLLEEYVAEFRKYASLRQAIKAAKAKADENRSRADIIAYRLGRLDKLNPSPGELTSIEARYEALSNAEDLKDRLSKARTALEGNDGGGAMGMISEASASLGDVDFKVWGEDTGSILGRLKQCYVEIKDIARTVESVMESVDCEPASLAKLSSRMDEYYSALKEFNVDSDTRLAEMRKELREAYEAIQGNDPDTARMEKEARETAVRLKALGAKLSERRREAAEEVGREIESEGKTLGLENLQFKISLEETRLSRTGGDAISFNASFNKNQSPRPVGEMASGGEMARLMLAVKKVSSRRLQLPTIVFDEIDTGVSGKIADRMGEMMGEMGRDMQIITITHLPQVAAKGKRHFKVYKQDTSEKTVSDVMLLEGDERVNEIARMLSGRNLNRAAVENAMSLLSDHNPN